jgi:hypothetical protein
LFLRPEAYRAESGSTKKVLVFNGSFAGSINSVSLSVVDELISRGAAGTVSVPTDSWTKTKTRSGFWRSFLKSDTANLKNTNSFDLKLSQAGSQVVGITLHPSRIAMEPEAFLDYLKTEVYTEINLADHGIVGPNDLVRERYIKMAKTLIQVGDQVTNEVIKPLGQLAEIVPLTHPNLAKKGDQLKFQILLEGTPLAQQTVAVGRQQKTNHETDEDRILLISDETGTIEFPITHTGVWWLKFIHIRRASDEDTMDFDSFWGSLTFEIN